MFFIRSWWLEVARGEKEQDKEELFLSARAEVWCPCCKKVCQLETKKYSFDAGTEFLQEWQARDLFEPKRCPHCGIYFSFPDKAEKSLREALAKQLTKEWLDEELRKFRFRYQP